jgi:hypothetical protein
MECSVFGEISDIAAENKIPDAETSKSIKALSLTENQHLMGTLSILNNH